MIVNDLLRRGAKLHPDRTAIRCGGRDWSYAELNARVNRLAGGLWRRGLRKGDRIAILAASCTQYVETYLASARIGVVTIPLNARLKGDELSYIIDHGEAKALLVGAEFVELIASIRAGLLQVRHFVCIGAPAAGWDGWDSLLDGPGVSEPAVQVAESDALIQLYTSGTTGTPKGAVLTHRNVLTNALGCCLEQDIRPRDNWLMVLPLYHVAGFTLCVSALLMGGMVTIHPAFQPADVVRSIAQDRITHVALVPVMMSFLLRVPDLAQADFSSLRCVVYGAAPIAPHVLEQLMRVLGCNFIQGYGLTEAAAFVSLLRAEDHVADGSPEQIRRLASIGREIIGAEVKVVDEHGADVAPGAVGEIVVRGDNVMHGYWKMPDETAEALRDGWLHTGDLATVDDAGYIFIVDRSKDMIISGGENIYPREIEQVLLTHPAVADAAVIGVPDEVWGEAVKALVVPKEGQAPTAQEIVDFCAAKLAGYKKPKSVEFTAELPRNAMGKVLKRSLREPYWQGHERRVH